MEKYMIFDLIFISVYYPTLMLIRYSCWSPLKVKFRDAAELKMLMFYSSLTP